MPPTDVWRPIQLITGLSLELQRWHKGRGRGICTKKKLSWKGIKVREGGGGGGGGQGRCERRSEAFVKIQKKIIFFWGGGGGESD